MSIRSIGADCDLRQTFATVTTATTMSALVFYLSNSTLGVRATPSVGFRWVATIVLTATAGLSVAPLGYAQERLPDGGVAVGAGLGPVAAWYGRPTMRYGHGVVGDALEGGSLVVTAPDGRHQEIVLPDRFVFEDITPVSLISTATESSRSSQSVATFRAARQSLFMSSTEDGFSSVPRPSRSVNQTAGSRLPPLPTLPETGGRRLPLFARRISAGCSRSCR